MSQILLRSYLGSCVKILLFSDHFIRLFQNQNLQTKLPHQPFAPSPINHSWQIKATYHSIDLFLNSCFHSFIHHLVFLSPYLLEVYSIYHIQNYKLKEYSKFNKPPNQTIAINIYLKVSSFTCPYNDNGQWYIYIRNWASFLPPITPSSINKRTAYICLAFITWAYYKSI